MALTALAGAAASSGAIGGGGDAPSGPIDVTTGPVQTSAGNGWSFAPGAPSRFPWKTAAIGLGILVAVIGAGVVLGKIK